MIKQVELMMKQVELMMKQIVTFPAALRMNVVTIPILIFIQNKFKYKLRIPSQKQKAQLLKLEV
jgi:uncharacterized membrane protein